MAGTTSIIDEAQERFLAAVRSAQDATVGAVRSWAEIIQKAGLSAPTPVMPSLRPLPEVVDGAYGFAGELLRAQREFTRGLLEAWSPATPGAGKTPRSAPTAS